MLAINILILGLFIWGIYRQIKANIANRNAIADSNTTELTFKGFSIDWTRLALYVSVFALNFYQIKDAEYDQQDLTSMLGFLSTLFIVLAILTDIGLQLFYRRNRIIIGHGQIRYVGEEHKTLNTHSTIHVFLNRANNEVRIEGEQDFTITKSQLGTEKLITLLSYIQEERSKKGIHIKDDLEETLTKFKPN